MGTRDSSMPIQPAAARAERLPWIPSPTVKVFVLAWTSFACAFAAAVAAYLVSLWFSWEPKDGSPLLAPLLLLNPLVLGMLLFFACPAALLGFLASLGLLWRTNLQQSIPIVSGVTILTAAVCGPLHFVAAFLAMLAGLAAMFFCMHELRLPGDTRQAERLFHL